MEGHLLMSLLDFIFLHMICIVILLVLGAAWVASTHQLSRARKYKAVWQWIHAVVMLLLLVGLIAYAILCNTVRYTI
jgi:threonine/homoserine/homoserine lactone efflux protein